MIAARFSRASSIVQAAVSPLKIIADQAMMQNRSLKSDEYKHINR
jgi:hypothetical protein